MNLGEKRSWQYSTGAALRPWPGTLLRERRHTLNSLPIKKMQVIGYRGLTQTRLCIPLPIKVRRFRGDFGGSEARFALSWVGAAGIVEFSLRQG
ncbi:MAG TPA: hypothetical protein VGR84_14840 [Candidatus Acidoferrales bacterium]|nr:hypothetical protein [Candidatus Acidoferrales bacterium]